MTPETPDNTPNKQSNAYNRVISDARKDGAPEGIRVSDSDFSEILDYLREQKKEFDRKLNSQIDQGNTIKGRKIA